MLEESIRKTAEAVDLLIEASLMGNGSPLYKSAYHLPSQGGKRMRPFLVVKSCELSGGDVRKALPAAASVELLHNFTLVHDDIMDNDLLRRGSPTVHTVWGIPMAILSGDLLFAKAFEVLLAGTVSSDALRRSGQVLAEATVRLSEGQSLDMSFEDQLEVSEAEYLEMISGKTAALFEACAKIGCIIAGGNEDAIKSLGRYGWNMGMAFQIFDDYLGLTSKEEVLGKSVGNDIREGKKTLIVIKTLETSVKEPLIRLLGQKNASDADLTSLISEIKSHGILDYVRGKAVFYVESANSSISGFPDSPAKDELIELAEYTIMRRK
ncbi:MAG: polyprenyl synthetase family protein [Candidatus Methanomethylicus sp.]|nr:polyprenyl synthetase family protein [Candidatus Methanomethylicus sp.]